MAGLAGLPYFLQYQQQAQNEAIQRQQAQMQLAQFQQAQQDRQRLQAAQAAAGNALPQLFAGGQPAQLQAPPAPQPPAPGQGSQPVQQASGGVPLPQGPVPGQVNRSPLPPGGPQGAMPPQPFRPMPTQPPAAQPQAAGIPSPPQQQAPTQAQQPGPLTFEGAVKVLRDQGLEGADLFAGLQQLMPVLDTQAKQQAAQAQQQFQHQLQLAQLQERYDALKQRSEDASLNREQRAQAHQDSMALQQIALSLRAQALQQRIQGNPDTALSKDDLKFMAQQYVAAPDPSIFTNLGRGAQGAKNVVQLRQAIRDEAKSQGLSGADLAALGIGVQGEKAFARATGTRTAAIETAAAEFQQVSPIVRQASAALPRTQAIPINEVLQAAQTGTGDPRWVKLGQAIDTATNVYARAISPTGVPTEGSRQQARAHFKASMTPEQIESVLGVMDQEVAAARRAPAEVKASQRERISGGAKPAGAIPQGWSVTEH